MILPPFLLISLQSLLSPWFYSTCTKIACPSCWWYGTTVAMALSYIASGTIDAMTPTWFRNLTNQNNRIKKSLMYKIKTNLISMFLRMVHQMRMVQQHLHNWNLCDDKCANVNSIKTLIISTNSAQMAARKCRSARVTGHTYAHTRRHAHKWLLIN